MNLIEDIPLVTPAIHCYEHQFEEREVMALHEKVIEAVRVAEVYADCAARPKEKIPAIPLFSGIKQTNKQTSLCEGIAR